MALKPKQDVEKSVWDDINPAIVWDADKFILPALPEKITLEKAAQVLNRAAAHENQTYRAFEIIHGYPLDAAVAFSRALDQMYKGLATGQSRHHWLFGEQPPTFMGVKVGKHDEDVVQVPMGDFKLPDMDDNVITSQINWDEGHFVIYGNVKKKYREIVLNLATLTRKLLRERSIYKGKAIRLPPDLEGHIDLRKPPEYLDVSDTTERSLIFDPKVQADIMTNLIVPIRFKDQCRQENIPLCRRVLIEGPYGVGKSLAARWVANEAEQNGWTFLMLDRIEGLHEAIGFAVRYQPAIVFAEDIDRMFTDEHGNHSQRTDDGNQLINTISGLLTPGSEVMVIFTTNHIMHIPQVMLRPGGRVDAIINLRNPEEEACGRLIKHYAGPLLAEGSDLSEAVPAVLGMNPGSIAEAVKRAKLGMIGRKDNHIIPEDVIVAATSMKFHMELLKDKTPEPSDAEKLHESLSKVAGNGKLKEVVVQHEKVDKNIKALATAMGVRLPS